MHVYSQKFLWQMSRAILYNVGTFNWTYTEACSIHFLGKHLQYSFPKTVSKAADFKEIEEFKAIKR